MHRSGGLGRLADVFISYKREDGAKVRKLVDALRGAGLDTWWDEDIPPAAPWEATIEKALRDAKAVIVCWSPDAVASANVRSEARVAREDGRLIQLFLRPCQPPLFFGEQQGVDLGNWRGRADDPRIAKIAESARKVAAGERVEGVEPARKRRLDVRIAALAAALLLIIAGAGAWWFLRPVTETGPQTLAVLPFRALNPADANLVDAIWDDTRGAISRNPNLRVLGRETVTALADKHLEPAAYRRKAGADFLLDGSVQHVGEQVQMKFNLVRTSDGAEIWSGRIGGKLDDVFAFQQRVATEVEGRIRGRVAPGGGIKSENIATSADAYSLFADARAKIRKRGAPVREALPILKHVLAIDPNYAPAWADLAEAIKLTTAGDRAEEGRREMTAAIERALTLAPNLAKAHAVRGFILVSGPQAEQAFHRALELDPSDVEAWMWLGNSYLADNRVRQALEAHSRAVELDPLWFSSMYNKMNDLAQLGDSNGLAAELRRVERTGDAHLTLVARAHVAYLTGHPGTQGRVLAELRRAYPDEPHKRDVEGVLLLLGYIDEAARIAEWPPLITAEFKGTPEPAATLRSRFPDPVQFWQADDHIDAPAMRLARLLPRHGRLAEYIGYYKAAFQNPDEFYTAVDWAGAGIRFLRVAPNAAINLRAGGLTKDADAILQKAEAIIEPQVRNGPVSNELLVWLAQLRAAEGRDDEAMARLGQAVAGGWLPDRAYYAADIAEEPCFARLMGRADFQAVRRRIFARYEEERRALGPVEQLLAA
jgi:TolB-like protein